MATEVAIVVCQLLFCLLVFCLLSLVCTRSCNNNNKICFNFVYFYQLFIMFVVVTISGSIYSSFVASHEVDSVEAAQLSLIIMTNSNDRMKDCMTATVTVM